MPSRNDGKEYEQLVYLVYQSLCGDDRFTELKRDVHLPGPDGERQIDVLVTHMHANAKYTTVIECRDFRGKLSVTHLDAFASKLLDVRANKGIMVSRNGFSKTAKQKAKRLGIELCSVDGAGTLLKQLVIEVPVVIVVVELLINITSLVENASDRQSVLAMKDRTTINDVPLRDLIIDDIRSGVVALPDEEQTISWTPAKLTPPYYLRDASNAKLDLRWFSVDVTISPEYFFGHTNDLPDFVSHVQENDPNARVFIPGTFRVGLNASFARFKSRSDVPAAAAGLIECIIFADQSTISQPGKAYVMKCR